MPTGLKSAATRSRVHMTDFTVRSDNVDVEQIMRQIRSRIREKRGVDYTEEEIRELANVKLEKFLDPRGVRSDLLEQFRAQARGLAAAELRVRGHDALTRRTAAILRFMRAAAAADPEAVLQSEPAHRGAAHPVEAERAAGRALEARRADYEVIHNLVLETDAARHRGEEPQDARRVDVEPARFRRAARARARRASCSTGPAPCRRCSRPPPAAAGPRDGAAADRGRAGGTAFAAPAAARTAPAGRSAGAEPKARTRSVDVARGTALAQDQAPRVASGVRERAPAALTAPRTTAPGGAAEQPRRGHDGASGDRRAPAEGWRDPGEGGDSGES